MENHNPNNDALHERDEQIRAILNAVTDAIVVIDRKGQIITVNPATERIFGYTQEELIGANVTILMPAPYCDEHGQYIRNYLDSRVPKIIGIGRELVGQRKDQTTFPIDLTVSEVDHLGMFTGIIRDITERKQTQERLLQSERLSAIGQAIAGLAHESRNALARIQANLRRLARRVNNQPELVELIDNALQAQEDIRQLFEDVRQYAAPMHLKMQFADLGELTAQVWDQLKVSRRGRECTLEHHLNNLDLRCEIDRFAIGNAIRNIFENSLSICDDPVHIAVTYFMDQHDARDMICMCIHDNGPGLQPEQTERVFEPFYTTKTQGTGLGLAIVKRTLEAHHGSAVVGHRKGAGAAFILCMPKTQQ